jgi:hypothetical protein
MYLINHVHHQVWHNIGKRWREAHFKLAKSLCNELFQAWQLSFIDDLLCDEVEEVTETCINRGGCFMSNVSVNRLTVAGGIRQPPWLTF